jgi:hypothetical protein
MDDPTTIVRLRRLLGKTAMLDSRGIALVQVPTDEIPDVPGVTFYGWVSIRAGLLLKDRRDRVIIKLTASALASLKTAVETVGHELHHIGEILAGAGSSVKAAEAASRAYLRRFVQRLSRLE